MLVSSEDVYRARHGDCYCMLGVAPGGTQRGGGAGMYVYYGPSGMFNQIKSDVIYIAPLLSPLNMAEYRQQKNPMMHSDVQALLLCLLMAMSRVNHTQQ